MLELLWAKSSPWKSLRQHMLDVGACVEAYLSASSLVAILGTLAESWGCTREQAVNRSAYLCALHDIGKAHPSFQKGDAAAYERWKAAGAEALFFGCAAEGFRHEYYIAEIMEEIWGAWDWNWEAIRIFCRVLSLHHQKADPGASLWGRLKPAWRKMQIELADEMKHVFLPEDEMELPLHQDVICTLLSSIMILCDWVASSGPLQ